MQSKKIESITCNNCETIFTTESPTHGITPCKCGNIQCDVTPHHIRTMDCFEKGYIYRVNGIIITPIESKSLFDEKLGKLKANKEAVYTLMEQEAAEPETIAHYEEQAKELGDIDVEIIKEESFKMMNQNGDDTLLIEDDFSDDDLNEWTWEEKEQ